MAGRSFLAGIGRHAPGQALLYPASRMTVVPGKKARNKSWLFKMGADCGLLGRAELNSHSSIHSLFLTETKGGRNKYGPGGVISLEKVHSHLCCVKSVEG